MHTKYSTKTEINKVRLGFTNKKITAYGGFSLLTAFFEKIIPVNEISPNDRGGHVKFASKITLVSYLFSPSNSYPFFFFENPSIPPLTKGSFLSPL